MKVTPLLPVTMICEIRQCFFVFLSFLISKCALEAGFGSASIPLSHIIYLHKNKRRRRSLIFLKVRLVGRTLTFVQSFLN